MTKIDKTEGIRRILVELINKNPKTLEEFKKEYGEKDVWDTKELQRDFVVHSFLAPFVFVTRKSDGKDGIISFQHSPRVYFNFSEDNL